MFTRTTIIHKGYPHRYPDLRAYSSERKVKCYEHRAKYHYDRFILESTRKGNFICIFPRKNSLPLYRNLMQDVGAEKWDERLYDDLFGTFRELDAELVARTHEQLLNCQKYPNRLSLSSDVYMLLSSSFSEAELYSKRMTLPDVSYAERLPKVRSDVRKRTQSLIEREDTNIEVPLASVHDGSLFIQQGSYQL
ncbi:hypothetical protein AB6A40_009924 [Gnathostoma spinigerum]|uniref:Uncharacterized protein n=1 Tax=Gnathostoma spinigerum TaxID=75299 RepID=A0ABD6EUM1_9BILA